MHAIHRLPARKQEGKSSPAIIVKLNSRIKKSKLVEASKEKRLTGIYISNHLSQYTQKIYSEARELKRSGKVKYAWEKEGKIYVRRTDDSKAERMDNYSGTRAEEPVTRTEEIPRNTRSVSKQRTLMQLGVSSAQSNK